MPHPLLAPLPYRPDSAPLFEALADRPWAVFLDSGPPEARQGRFDIICCDPTATLVSHGGTLQVSGEEEHPQADDDPLTRLRRLLGARGERPAAIPFAGGAVGFLGYELGRRLEGLPAAIAPTPEAAFGIYDWAVVVDHGLRRAWLVGQGRDPRTARRWQELVDLFTDPPEPPLREPFRPSGRPRVNMDADRYGPAFGKARRYIHDGDCYQVNLARRFSIPVAGDPWAAYRRLRRVNPAPHAAYLNLPGLQLLSSSPERFLRLTEGAVETRPIKGTRPRGASEEADRRLAGELAGSAKDRAENLMIVDLLRNDLGKCCLPGSIAVPSLFAVESFATVHHLVSSVTGRLAPGLDAFDLLRGAFPGGSITGAPKRRAMEIIDELESDPREAYCGAIGYIGFDGDMDSNIAIRTMIHEGGEARFWAGSGIVADSVMEAEFQETLDKAAGIMRLFEEP